VLKVLTAGCQGSGHSLGCCRAVQPPTRDGLAHGGQCLLEQAGQCTPQAQHHRLQRPEGSLPQQIPHTMLQQIQRLQVHARGWG
jgi:hypothetical protein